MATPRISEITEDEIIEVERDPWTDNFFRPFIIVAMIMCFNIGLVNFARLGNPAWRGGYFLLAMFLTTVEAIYSYRVLQRYIMKGISVTRYRLAEAAVLILIIKLLGFMGKSLSLLLLQVQVMWQTPGLFFDNEFIISAILALISWGAATQTIGDFEALYDPYIDNRATLDRLTERFFWGGGILVLLSGLTQWVIRAGVASLVDWDRPNLGGVILNVLLYFTLGLILLSQVNLSRLMIHWRTQDITPPEGLRRDWAKYGLIFLGLVTLVAFLLPTRYTLGFLATAGAAVQFLIDLFLFLFRLVVVLITLPLAWILSLFGLGAGGGPGGGAAPPPVFPSPAAGASYPWLEFLRSLVFWLLALGIIGYFLKVYLEDHPELLDSLKKFKPLALIVNLLSSLWSLIWGWTRAGLELIPNALKITKQEKNGGSSRGGLSGWLGLRRLSARERILYYYLNVLERAEKKAPGRKQHETPYEYEPNLSHSVPDVQLEIHELTDTFVQARYSQKPFTEEEVARIKQEWQRIRNALRRGSSKDTPGPTDA